MESTELSALLDSLHPHNHSQQCAFCELMDWAKGKSLPEVWKQCPRVDWLIWLCGKMAGNEGWPTVESIVVAVRALNNYSPRFELRKATEVANYWKVGRASLEELCNEIETSVSAYGRTGGWLKPPGYSRVDALRDAADIVRRALKTPSACLEQGPRILIVNDEEQIREIIGSMLTSAGYKCEAVARGFDALSLLEAGENFDLLLTDMLNLPMDGFSLLQQAKAKFPNMPVIVVSTVNDKDLIRPCIHEGAYHYLTIPFEPEHLLDVVRCALKGYSHTSNRERAAWLADALPEYDRLMSHLHRHERPQDEVALEVLTEPAEATHSNSDGAVHFNPDDWPNDYSNPNAIASEFQTIKERLDDIDDKLSESDSDHRDRSGETGIWVLGSAIAVVLSWSRNGSILYCIGHGILSWCYVIYFAVTR